MAEVKVKKGQWELIKFVGRYVLLIGVPILFKELTNLEGEWGVLFGQIIPVVSPYIDRLLHNNEKIPVNGLVPF